MDERIAHSLTANYATMFEWVKPVSITFIAMSTQNELKIIETFQNVYKFHQKFYQDDLSHQGAKQVSMFIVTLETSSGQQSSLSYANKERY